MKDSQKSRVYKAEQLLRRHISHEYLGDIEACQAYIDKVLARKYIQKHYPTHSRNGRTPYAPILIKSIPGKHRWAHAYCPEGRIELGSGDLAAWSRTNSVILHELAHILAWRKHLEHTGSHDWAFAAVFLDLVRHMMGADAANTLKREYKAYKVRTSPPRTRTMTVAQKDAATARLEAARLKREEALKPKREMKQKAIELHHKKWIGVNNFGNICYDHYLGSEMGRRVRIAKNPSLMSYAEIEHALARYNKLQDRIIDPMMYDNPRVTEPVAWWSAYTAAKAVDFATSSPYATMSLDVY